MHLYLDIETVPAQASWVRDELALSVKPPGTLKKPESIAAWERDEKTAAVDAALLNTAFDGAFGQIVCIGWAVDDGEADSVHARDLSREEEVWMLDAFFDEMKAIYAGTSGRAPTIVGHNVVAFDLGFLWKRAMVLGVKPPFWFPRNPKPWGDAVFDTMTEWCGTRDRISLDRLCKVLGLDGKGDGPTGADVWPMVQAGLMDKVAEYCRADVERTRRVHRRMTFAEAA